MGKLLLFFLLPILLLSEEISLEWLKDKPKSYTKDFFIYQFLKQKITSEEAYEALFQTKYVNKNIFFEFAKKSGHDETVAVMQCMKENLENLIEENSDCLSAGFTTYKATKLNQLQIEKTIEKLDGKFEDEVKILKILKSPIPFTKLISSDEETFFNTFNECGSNFREKYFNYKLPKHTINRLISNEKFNQTIKLIITNPELTTIQKSILDLNSTNLTHQTTFLLAINAITHNDINRANNYLDSSFEKAYYQFDKDKVLFWKYLVNDNKGYLKELSNSWDINIYSLYAMEVENKKPKNIFYNIENEEINSSNFNAEDPFAWIQVLNNSRKMDTDEFENYRKIFNTNSTLGHLAFVTERYFNYKNSYFITPYSDILKDIPIKRQTLIYSIARQESRFIPTSLSPSYAMGIMQIMPFLSEEIATKLGEPYNIYDQFKPEVNLRYANSHLDYLESKLNNPLFIAYAYNGGIGFLNRTLKKGFFHFESRLEPFLSMELIPYDESRKYGKKVLANYYIYNNYLNKENQIKLSSIFQNLK